MTLSDEDPILPHEVREFTDEKLEVVAKILSQRVLFDAMSSIVTAVDDIDPAVRKQERALRDAVVAEFARRNLPRANIIREFLKAL